MGRLFDLEESGYFYTRLQNPTNDIVAAQLASLEGGVAGMLTSSGQAANLFACLNLCCAGDHIVSAGLAMVSPKTAFVFSRKAAFSSSSVQSGETKVVSMPIRAMVTLIRLKVPP